jgi:gluconate kinase
MTKCDICKRNIDSTFLDKLQGTKVYIKDGDKNREFLVCSECQRKHKDNLREELKKANNLK